MKLMGLVDGRPTEHDDKYVKEYDPATGVLVSTHNIDEAKHYPSIIEAWDDWKQPDPRHPIRAGDGKPNRPLTSFSVTFDPVPEP